MLSICLMMFGVYAAANPYVSISGQVSYSARDVKVLVQGKVNGAKDRTTNEQMSVVDYPNATVTANDLVATKVTSSTTRYLDYTVGTGNNDMTDNLSTWNIGTQEFYEDSTGVKSIIISFKLTNLSTYPVKASITFAKSDNELLNANVKRKTSVTEIILNQNGGNNEIEIEYNVDNDSQPVNASNLLNMEIKFEKTVLVTEERENAYKFSGENSDGRATGIITMGKSSADVSQDDIQWKCIAYSIDGKKYTKTSGAIPANAKFGYFVLHSYVESLDSLPFLSSTKYTQNANDNEYYHNEAGLTSVYANDYYYSDAREVLKNLETVLNIDTTSKEYKAIEGRTIGDLYKGNNVTLTLNTEDMSTTLTEQIDLDLPVNANKNEKDNFWLLSYQEVVDYTPDITSAGFCYDWLRSSGNMNDLTGHDGTFPISKSLNVVTNVIDVIDGDISALQGANVGNPDTNNYLLMVRPTCVLALDDSAAENLNVVIGGRVGLDNGMQNGEFTNIQWLGKVNVLDQETVVEYPASSEIINTGLQLSQSSACSWDIGKYLDFSESTQSKQIQICLKITNNNASSVRTNVIFEKTDVDLAHYSIARTTSFESVVIPASETKELIVTYTITAPNSSVFGEGFLNMEVNTMRTLETSGTISYSTRSSDLTFLLKGKINDYENTASTYPNESEGYINTDTQFLSSSLVNNWTVNKIINFPRNGSSTKKFVVSLYIKNMSSQNVKIFITFSKDDATLSSVGFLRSTSWTEAIIECGTEKELTITYTVTNNAVNAKNYLNMNVQFDLIQNTVSYLNSNGYKVKMGKTQSSYRFDNVEWRCIAYTEDNGVTWTRLDENSTDGIPVTAQYGYFILDRYNSELSSVQYVPTPVISGVNKNDYYYSNLRKFLNNSVAKYLYINTNGLIYKSIKGRTLTDLYSTMAWDGSKVTDPQKAKMSTEDKFWLLSYIEAKNFFYYTSDGRWKDDYETHHDYFLRSPGRNDTSSGVYVYQNNDKTAEVTMTNTGKGGVRPAFMLEFSK